MQVLRTQCLQQRTIAGFQSNHFTLNPPSHRASECMSISSKNWLARANKCLQIENFRNNNSRPNQNPAATTKPIWYAYMTYIPTDIHHMHTYRQTYRHTNIQTHTHRTKQNNKKQKRTLRRIVCIYVCFLQYKTQHSAPVPENPRSNTSPGPVPESGTGAGRTFNSQNREVIIDRLRCSMVEVARKRKKSVSMACATNAPRKHKSTTILNRNGSQGYPPKVYGLLQNSKICRQARSLDCVWLWIRRSF